MGTGERVGWLQSAAELLQEQQAAMAARDVDAFLVSAQRLEHLFGRGLQAFDSPPTPMERAWLRRLTRYQRHHRRTLRTMTEPLLALDALAREVDACVALDCRA